MPLGKCSNMVVSARFSQFFGKHRHLIVVHNMGQSNRYCTMRVVVAGYCASAPHRRLGCVSPSDYYREPSAFSLTPAF